MNILKMVKGASEEFIIWNNRNKYRSNDHSLTMQPYKVNLREWSVKKTGLDFYNPDKPYNLGDTLSRVVVEWMLSRKGLSLNSKANKTTQLFAIGSGITHSYADATIWGNGIEYAPYRRVVKILHSKYFRKLDVRAVRGPLSRTVLLSLGHKCPESYGDPAILMPYIYQPQKSLSGGGRIAIIPQFVTERNVRERYPEADVISMCTDDYVSVINGIINCDKIITSSLHGIILAETYGVPAVFYRGLSKRTDFKYLDWYHSTGRFDIHIAESIEEAITMDAPPLPDLKKMQQGLLDSFPYDLWE